MRALDVVSFALLQDFKAATKKEQLSLTDNKFAESIANNFFCASHSCSSRRIIKLVEGWKTPQGIESLSKSIQTGYWVYLYFSPVGYSEFRWYNSESRANRTFEKFNNLWLRSCMLFKVGINSIKRVK